MSHEGQNTNQLPEVDQLVFLSPYTTSSKLAVIHGNKPYRLVGFRDSGFGVFKTIDSTCARYVREADSETINEYFRLLPPVHLILICETNLGWCAYPVDSNQEVIVRNVVGSKRFDSVVARFDGQSFWYHEPFLKGDVAKSSALRDAFALRDTKESEVAFSQIKGVTPEESKSFTLALSSWHIFKKLHPEYNEFDTIVVNGDNIEINWRSQGGGRYNSFVQKDSLDVVSPGVCLESGKLIQ